MWLCCTPDYSKVTWIKGGDGRRRPGCDGRDSEGRRDTWAGHGYMTSQARAAGLGLSPRGGRGRAGRGLAGLAGAGAEAAALEEAAGAGLAVELPVLDQDVAALHHDLGIAADLAALVAAVVDPHVVGASRDRALGVRVE